MLQNEAHVEERIRKYGLFEIYNSEITLPSIYLRTSCDFGLLMGLSLYVWRSSASIHGLIIDTLLISFYGGEPMRSSAYYFFFVVLSNFAQNFFPCSLSFSVNAAASSAAFFSSSALAYA